MNPLLSIAIPTHNRARYAIPALQSLLAIPDPRLEVVVSDTSTDGLLQTALETTNRDLSSDSRLKYLRPSRQLDMTGNHNEAISAASGKYICLIGDDDTISAEALSAAAWADDNDVEIIAPDVVANYAWPDFRSRYFGKGHAARLYFAKSFEGWRWEDSAKALERALGNAGQGTDGLPKIYHGIVRRSVMDKLRANTEGYFHGSSPDVSGAMGLAAVSSRFLVVRYPLTIPGASGGSNTGRSALNQHKGRLSGEAQTRGFVKEGWSLGVPRFFSVETVWAHAALETLDHLAPQLKQQFNFARLLGVCRALHKEYGREIDAARTEAANFLGVDEAILAKEIDTNKRQFRLQRYMHLLRRALRPTAAGGREHVDNLHTIADTPAHLEQTLRARGQSWDQFAASINTPPSNAGR